MTPIPTKRIESIDIVRGIAMLVMALDHVRDFFHISANVENPLDLDTTTPALFFTRWTTHFCAPIFVFLSGASIYLQSQRKTTQELGSFLLKRGLWFILAEWTIIAFAWTFNPFFNLIPFQVIWAIGISMVFLGIIILVKIPYKLILLLGLIIVAGHNIFDFAEAAPDFKANFCWDLLHHGTFKPYEFAPQHYVFLVYAFPVWTGVMMLGYCSGILFTPVYAVERRKKILTRMGWGLIVFFVALRSINAYGDPVDWSFQKDALYTFLSFIKANKYPASLLYLCMTIGPALILLALIENIKNKFTDSLAIFGRTAFFYYVVHLFLIHLLTTICFFARGHSMADAIDFAQQYPFLFVAPGEGYPLWVVYSVWLTVIIALYPLCRWFDRYKTSHKEKWWLSYL